MERRRQPRTDRPALRPKTVKVKTARGRKNSSQRWLQRQLNDPYVYEARALGYRSRAAFKLEQLDDKYKFLRPGKVVVDLGAAPGGWTQVALQRLKNKTPVIGIDLLPIDPIPGADFVEGDFLDSAIYNSFKTRFKDGADVVMSDMAAVTTGHSNTDHIRTIALAESAYTFARSVLKKGGVFIAKVFQGGADSTLLENLKRDFEIIKHHKPPASRKESPEMYVVALNFRQDN
tara:strand:+ start:1422 stop:2117 length:696 start_codon:yes stop_codon:yes gene_type:complete